MKKSNCKRIEELKQLYKQEFLKQKQVLERLKRTKHLKHIEYALQKLEGIKEKLNEPDYWIEQLNQKSSIAEAMLDIIMEAEKSSSSNNSTSSVEENTQSPSKTIDTFTSSEESPSPFNETSEPPSSKTLDDLEL